jgi:DNA polymerase|nr:MAG TPA: DNA polymerase [Caudoviricetes sp.]
MSSPFYTNVSIQKNKVVHRFVDKHGNRQIEVVPHQFNLFIKAKETDEPDSFSLYGDALKRKVFDSNREMREYVKEYNDLFDIYGMQDAYIQFIADTYPEEEIAFDMQYIRIANIDIETEIGKGFPKPQEAAQQVNSITVRMIGSQNSITFTTLDYRPELDTMKDDCSEVIVCKDEVELFKKFLNLWQYLSPDAVSGWNCVPLTNTVWKPTFIDTMKCVKPKDILVDSGLIHKFPITQKRVVKTRLDNGRDILSSKDHIFPIWYLPKGKYINNDVQNLIYAEKRIEDIQLLLKNNNVYMSQPLHENTNPDLTWRKLALNNLDWFHDRGIVITWRPSTSLVKKVSAVLGYPARETHHTLELWNSFTIANLLSEEEVIQELTTVDIIGFAPIKHKHWMIRKNADDVLTDDELWFMGMWFTDGTSTYKTECSISNTNQSIIDRLVNFLGVSSWKSNRDYDANVQWVKFGLSRYWLYKTFIYQDLPARSKKLPNMRFLSMLSKRQFCAFLAGLIDGDGYNSDKAVSFASIRREEVSSSLAELLQWNGFFSIVDDNGVRIYIDDQSFTTNVIAKYKLPNGKSSAYRAHTSNSRRWLGDGEYVLVREIIQTDDVVPMCDILTTTHFFVSNGFKTHNCNRFDFPFLINRGLKIVPDDIYKLSPIYKHVYGSPFRDVSRFEGKPEGSIYEIAGLDLLDYHDLYKKFNYDTLPDYKLETVAQHELGKGKLDYCGFDSLKEFYLGNPTMFVRYNIRDVALINELDEKLKYLYLVYTVAYQGHVNPTHIFGEVKYWDCVVYNELKRAGIQIPPNRQKQKQPFVGAFVNDVIVGKSRWVVAFDLTSLN